MPTNTVDMTYKSSDGHNNEKKKRCKTTWMDRLKKPCRNETYSQGNGKTGKNGKKDAENARF